MGLLDIFTRRPKIPPFSVCVYGKLPCHHEYFQISLDPAFDQFKAALMEGIELFNRHKLPRPQVYPNRRIFVRMSGSRVDLAGCIWESDDGQRAFPFFMAVPLPKKIRHFEAPIFYEALQALWTYLEAYYADIRVQLTAAEVYRRLRGIVHELEPIRDAPSLKEPPIKTRFTEIPLDGDPEAERAIFQTLNFEENPSFILFPTPSQAPLQDVSLRTGYVGFSGQADFEMAYLREGAQAYLEQEQAEASPSEELQAEEVEELQAEEMEELQDEEVEELQGEELELLEEEANGQEPLRSIQPSDLEDSGWQSPGQGTNES